MFNWLSKFTTITITGPTTKDAVIEELKTGKLSLQHVQPQFRDDEEIVKTALKSLWRIQSSVCAFKYASKRIQDDENFILQLISDTTYSLPPDLLLYCSPRVRNIKNIAMQAILRQGESYKFVGEELQKDTDVIYHALAVNGELLQEMSEEIKSDPTAVLIAIHKSPNAFQYAHESLKEDKEFILLALSSSIKPANSYFQFSNENLKDDKEIALAFMKAGGNFDEISRELQDDFDVILECFNYSYYNSQKYNWERLAKTLTINENEECLLKLISIKPLFFTACYSKQKERDFLLFALQKLADSIDTESKHVINDINITRYAHDFYQDKEIMIETGKLDFQLKGNYQYFGDDIDFFEKTLPHNGLLIKFASNDIKSNRTLAKIAVQSNNTALEFVDKKFLNDKEIILIAIQRSSFTYVKIYNEIFLDYEVISLCILNNISLELPEKLINSFENLPNFFLDDIEFVKPIFERFPILIKNHKLSNDKKFILSIIEPTFGFIIRYISNDLLHDDDVILSCIQNNGVTIKFAPEKYLNDKNFICLALSNNRDVLKFIPSHFNNDRDIFLAASRNNDVHQYTSVFKYIPEQFQNDREIVLGFCKVESCLRLVPIIFRDDKEIVLASVSRDGETLSFASERLKDDKDVVLATIKNSPFAIERATSRLCNDPEFLLEAFDIDPTVLEKVPRFPLAHDTEFAKDLIINRNYTGNFFSSVVTIKQFVLHTGKAKSARK